MRFTEPNRQDQQGIRQSSFRSRNQRIPAARGRKGESEGIHICARSMQVLVLEGFFPCAPDLRILDERGLFLALLHCCRDWLQSHPQPVSHEHFLAHLSTSDFVCVQQIGEESQLDCVHISSSDIFIGFDLHRGASQLRRLWSCAHTDGLGHVHKVQHYFLHFP